MVVMFANASLACIMLPLPTDAMVIAEHHPGGVPGEGEEARGPIEKGNDNDGDRTAAVMVVVASVVSGWK
uniref:Putative secreted protein n=1 Tax=Anopheles triannulatus TaxID=58253 RepID=A0A2M4B7F8_9DIPT